MPQLTDIARSVVYKAPDHYANQAIAIQLKHGEVVAIFNEERGLAHRDNGYSALIRSRDGGRTWDADSYAVVLPATETEGNWDPAIVQLRDGTVMVNLCQTAFFKRGIAWDGPQYDAGVYGAVKRWTGTYVMKSTDDGHTWGRPIPVNTRPMKHGGTRTAVLELPDGGLLLAMYGMRVAEGIYATAETTRAYLVRSDDGGENWEYYSTLAYDPGHITSYSEPALLRLPDGRLICTLRAHNAPAQRPDNMHFVVSDDDGHTWSPPKRLNLWGYPTHLISLRDGRVLLTYGYRRGEFGVKGCISDDGLTWNVANAFSIHEGGQGPEWERTWWHTGYPSSVQLDDGAMLTVYHAFSQESRPVQYIEAARWALPG